MDEQTNRLIDVFPEWYGDKGAIFKALNATFSKDFPWLSAYKLLDTEYIGNHSGEKTISPLVFQMARQNESGTLTDDQIGTLAGIIANKFKNKWKRLYEVNEQEYNAIQNYSMHETETPDISRKHSASEDYALTDKKTNQTDYTVKTQTEATNGVYGFNSETPVPANESDGNTAVTTTGDAEKNIETNTRNQTGYTEDTETGTRTLEREGNIGVTTSQEMLESEIQLWQWIFFDSVYKDVDSVLTIPKYII